MKTKIALILQKISYKYKGSFLMAIVITCLSRLILLGSEGEYDLFRYILPLLAGGTIGYITGHFLDSRQRLLSASQRTATRLKKKIRQQHERGMWYTTLFKRNHAHFLLINATTGKVEEANPSACKFYGYSLKEFRQMTISELSTLPKEDINRTIKRTEIEGKSKIFSRHKLASGEARDVELLGGSIVLNGCSYLFLIVNDSTEEKVLRGVIPICSHCKQIRDKERQWYPMEEYIQYHSEATFSHGLCPTCARHHYPNLYEYHKT